MTTLPSSSEEIFEQTLDRFWETIPPMWAQIRNHIRTIAAENFGLSPEQFQILRHIQKGFHSASEIAAARHISRPAVSQASDALVEKGFIVRSEDPLDRRCVRLELTPAGSALLDSLFAQNRVWIAARLSTLQPEEIRAIYQALDALQSAFTL